MKDSNEISPSNPWKILYTYWATIPTRKNIDILTADKIRNQPVRYFLLDYIHQGKEDEYSKRNNLRRRHAFSAHELYIAYKDEVLGEQEHKFTIQNIHFHLKKLLETDLIYIVTSIVEGNHRIKYYGQTAKITLLKQKSSELLKREQKMTIEPFTTLLVKPNPSLSEQQIVDMLTATFELRANLKQIVVF
ncbi:MAG: hypothetical protein IH840_07115, partial [Candidatus Heimdallarchaeota archaeon]|nr:hypothetical protein [Candidatus Heimdallarchaeota archaeon]